MTGKVYLVGAGPGDPELLTIRAVNKIRAADIIMHDALISSEILVLASPWARILDVGKRCGVKNITQDEINSMMVRFAVVGNLVVRLKSGDPLIFGRAGEEISALREADVDFEIVPGVTSAVAAAAVAQIPLTDRRFSEEVLFISAHHALGKAKQNWRSLISSHTTVVVYMPGNHANVAEQLVQAGMDGQTPCVIISKISMPEEMVFQTKLASLQDIHALPAPSILIFGANASISNCPEFKNMASHIQ